MTSDVIKVAVLGSNGLPEIVGVPFKGRTGIKYVGLVVSILIGRDSLGTKRKKL
jgi:hypothetical protein